MRRIAYCVQFVILLFSVSSYALFKILTPQNKVYVILDEKITKNPSNLLYFPAWYSEVGGVLEQSNKS